MWEVSNKTSLINLFSVGMCDLCGLHLQPIHAATFCAHPSTHRPTVSLRENERCLSLDFLLFSSSSSRLLFEPQWLRSRTGEGQSQRRVSFVARG